MSLDVLVPFRGTTEHRLRLHRYTQALWSDPAWQHGGVRIYVASDGLALPEFNLARAVNTAFLQGSGEHVMIYGSGHAPPTLDHLTHVTDQLGKHPWLGVYAGVRVLDEKQTRGLLDGTITKDPRDLPAKRKVSHCIGIMAMRRDVFAEAGGMDERFVGWGYEDTAFRDILTRLYQKPPTPTGWLTTLWHPTAPRTTTAANKDLFRQQRNGAARGVRAYIEQRGRFV